MFATLLPHAVIRWLTLAAVAFALALAAMPNAGLYAL
jgi:hypothetical protein